MASQELIGNINEYEMHILDHGVTEEAILAFIEGIKTAYKGEHDYEIGKKISDRTRIHINQFLMDQFGGDFVEAEEYAQARNAEMEILDWYYQTLLLDAPYFLDSYALYIERDRPRRERFYEPRRKTLIRVTDKLQEMEDDRLDELFVHQPP